MPGLTTGQRLTLANIACLLTVLTHATATADDLYYENFRHGQRAMGMGGATIAVPGEPEATLYNPAALSLEKGVLFSGSMHFLGVETHTLRGGFQTPLEAPRDLISSELLALPSSSVSSTTFGEAEQHSLAFSTFLVSMIDDTFADTSARETTDTLRREQRIRTSRAQDDQLIYIGPSYAFRHSEKLSLGVSLFYAQRQQTSRQSTSATEHRFDGYQLVQTAFDDTFADADIEDSALLARVGVLFSPTSNLRLGVTATSPSVPLFGEGAFAYSFTDSGDPEDSSGVNPNHPNPFRNNLSAKGLDAQTRSPWNFAFGVAYETPSLTLAARTSLYLPIAYNRMVLSEEAVALTRPHFVNSIEREMVINGAVGAEWSPGRWPLRVGLFSNRSSAPAVPELATTPALPRVHRYGATISVGHLSDTSSINVGSEVQWGSGHDVTHKDPKLTWNPQFIRIDRDFISVTCFISGALEFASSTAQDLMKETEASR